VFFFARAGQNPPPRRSLLRANDQVNVRDLVPIAHQRLAQKEIRCHVDTLLSGSEGSSFFTGRLPFSSRSAPIRSRMAPSRSGSPTTISPSHVMSGDTVKAWLARLRYDLPSSSERHRTKDHSDLSSNSCV